MEILAWAKSDVGRARDHNEDSFLFAPEIHLFGVCDGMGGHAAGEVASALAVAKVQGAVERKREIIAAYARGEGERGTVLKLLEEAVKGACHAIHAEAQADLAKRGMGTTCSMMLLIAGARGDRGFIAHVGDSRIYLLRRGQIHQLTEDHSLVNELVRRGKLKREEIDSSPYANYKSALTRAVGVYETVEVDTIDFDVLGGDQFVLCSDGLGLHVGEPEIKDILATAPDGKGPELLVELANSRGGKDNVTTLHVRIGGEEALEVDARFRELNLRLERLRGMPIFQYLSYKELVKVLNIASVREAKPDEAILSEGSDGEELYIVLEGKVALHKDGAFLTHLTGGDHFGEMALVDRAPRSATVTAVDATRLLTIPRKEFYELVQAETPLSVKLLWSFVQVLAGRLRKTTADLSGARLQAEAVDLSGEISLEDDK
ncbi:MAG: cyclic nucleotide-binding domain-containing protein [Myxococcota bacterium]